MRAGELRHRVIIQQQTLAANAMGENVPAWSTFATVWAAIEPDTGSTTFSAKQLNANADGKIRIRYLDGLQPTMRIYWDGRYFNIISFYQPQEIKNQIIILYSEAKD